MSNLYELTNNVSILLYTSQNNILLRKKIGDNISRSKLLAMDFKQNLCGIIYDQIVYYAYIDINNHLILRRVTDSYPLYTKEHFPCQIPPQLRLVAFDGKLVIFYEEQADFDHKKLKGIFPFLPMSEIELKCQIPVSSDIYLLASKNEILINFESADGNQNYSLSKSMQISKLDSTFELKLILQEKDNEINKLNAMLESAKSQYNNLMDVANKYKNEAMKWCNKFAGN